MNCQDIQKLVTVYIKKELHGKKLEEFMEHIKTCKDCYEELEIYYTIQFALRQLDNNEQVTYDVREHLAEHLHQTEKKIYMKRRHNIYSLVLVFLAQMAVILTLVAQLQIWSTGNLESTVIYKIRAGTFHRQNNIVTEESENNQETKLDLEKKPEDNTSTIENIQENTPQSNDEAGERRNLVSSIYCRALKSRKPD